MHRIHPFDPANAFQPVALRGIEPRDSQQSRSLLLPIATVALCLVVSACSSAPAKPDIPPAPQETFTTNITPEGLKQFTYDLAMQSPKSDGGSGRSHSGGGHGGGMGGHGGGHGGHGQGGSTDQDSQAMQDRMKSRVTDRMEAKLKETAYCTAGYDELGSSFDQGHFQIAGQCKDHATDADRLHFPNVSISH